MIGRADEIGHWNELFILEALMKLRHLAMRVNEWDWEWEEDGEVHIVAASNTIPNEESCLPSFLASKR